MATMTKLKLLSDELLQRCWERSAIYDAENRFVGVIDAFGNRVDQRRYELDDSRAYIVDGNGNETTVIYDDRGNVVEEIDPLGNSTIRRYEDPRHPDRTFSCRAELYEVFLEKLRQWEDANKDTQTLDQFPINVQVNALAYVGYKMELERQVFVGFDFFIQCVAESLQDQNLKPLSNDINARELASAVLR